MSGLEQKRRTVRVMELMDESYAAYAAGDKATASLLMAEANGVDAVAVSGLAGGMIIGEVPSPQTDPKGWAGYLAAQKDSLTAAEQEAAL